MFDAEAIVSGTSENALMDRLKITITPNISLIDFWKLLIDPPKTTSRYPIYSKDQNYPKYLPNRPFFDAR